VPGLREYTGKVGKEEDPDNVDMAYRVVADHIRTLTMAITDGAVPSSDGRGYVLRRILRRACRYGVENLKAPEGFFHQLVDVVVDVMGDAFPELRKDPAAVKALIREEEDMFSRTLKKGIIELEKRSKKLQKGGMLPGADAFKMYDTFGFPLDLTLLMCEEKGFTVDVDGYEKEMVESKRLAREKGKFGDAAAYAIGAEQTDELSNKKQIPPTDDSPKFEWDSTGSGKEHAATLMAAITYDKAFVDGVDAAVGLVGLVLDSTSLYAEAGGQVADLATITTEAGAVFEVTDAQKFGGYVLHIGKCSGGSLAVGDKVTVKVDYARRALIAKNHTSTHMLNLALRKALKQTCDQRGSLCDADKLRFDFAYGKPLTPEEIADTQKFVSEQIAAALPVQTQVSGLDAAKAVNGLRAVFGETYPDPVRVVSVGGPGVQQMLDKPDEKEWHDYAIEFCGGTHIANAAEAKKFALVSEEGLGRGVRRIVGLTFEKAEAAFALASSLGARVEAAASLGGEAAAKELTEILQILESAVVPAMEKKALLTKVAEQRKKLLGASKDSAKATADAAKAEAEALAEASQGAPFVVARLKTAADAKVVEAALTAMLPKLSEVPLLVLGAGKTASALCVVPAGLVERINAKDWVNAALGPCGGKGGGKPGRAQGAARDASNMDAAEEAAKAFAAACTLG